MTFAPSSFASSAAPLSELRSVEFSTTSSATDAFTVDGAELGLIDGSIITSIDGVKISNRDAAIVRIRSYAPGAVITVVLTLPDGSSKSYKVTLGTAPAV